VSAVTRRAGAGSRCGWFTDESVEVRFPREFTGAVYRFVKHRPGEAFVARVVGLRTVGCRD